MTTDKSTESEMELEVRKAIWPGSLPIGITTTKRQAVAAINALKVKAPERLQKLKQEHKSCSPGCQLREMTEEDQQEIVNAIFGNEL